jgi:hypothetical protein
VHPEQGVVEGTTAPLSQSPPSISTSTLITMTTTLSAAHHRSNGWLRSSRHACGALAAGLTLATSLATAVAPAMAAELYQGPTTGPLQENDGYYARFSGEQFKYKNWDEARQYAENLYIVRGGKTYKGFLYTPNTPTENAFVTQNLQPSEDWIGLFQAPGAMAPDHNWKFLNNRVPQWYGWHRTEPDDQKNGAWTKCRLVNYFDGIKINVNKESVSFTPTVNKSKETGCENCGMIRGDGFWKDKECKSHGNGFIVEFRNI